MKISSRDLLGTHSPLIPEFRQPLSFLSREPVVCGARYAKHVEIPQDRIIAQQAFGQEVLALRQSDLVKQDTNGRHGMKQPDKQLTKTAGAKPVGRSS